MKIVVNNETITNDYIMTPMIEERILSSEEFTLRNAFSNNIEFTIMNIDGKYNDLQMLGKELIYYINDNNYRKYIVNSVVYEKLRIKVKANDFMTKLDSINYISSIEYPATYGQIIEELAQMCGFELEDKEIPHSDKVLTFKTTVSNLTCREALKQFGEAIQMIPYFNKDNKLEFVWFNDNVVEITDNEVKSFKQENRLEPINKVTVKIGENTYSKGVGENEYIIDNNIFINDQAMVLDDLYDKIFAFSYIPFTLNAIINQNLDLGCTISYNGFNYLYTGGKINSINIYDMQTKGKSLIKKETTSKNSLSTVINDISNRVAQIDKDYILDQAQQNATNLINNGIGGNIKLYPDRLLIMDTDNENTAQKVWQYNINGFAYSNNGINGEYKLAITQDGQIVGDFITTGLISVERIQGLANTLTGIQHRLDLDNESISSIRTSMGGSNLIRNSIGLDGYNYWENGHDSYSDTEIMQISGQKSCLLLMNKIAKQTIQVQNGTFTLSFIYKKLIELANGYVKINDYIIDLTSTNYENKEYTFEITNNEINIEIYSDTDNAFYLLNLLINYGDVKQAFTLNSNEIETDTVKIGKGMTITSSGIDTMLQALSNSIAFIKVSTNQVKTEFTDKGMKTENAEIENATISKVVFKNTGRQTLISRLKVGG